MLGNKKTQEGFAVLITIVILMAIMLVVVSSSALVSWNVRRGVLERGYEAVAKARAESCLQVAAARLSVNAAYGAGEVVNGLPDGGSCTVSSVTASGGNFTVTVTSTNQNAVSTLEGQISGTTYAISRVRLLPN